MPRPGTIDYVVLRLRNFDARSWAVIERPSGAIALDREDQLLIRLSEDEARTLADLMTAALRNPPETSELAPDPNDTIPPPTATTPTS